MSIDQKVKDFKIKKILIVDDTQENIEGAKQYFKTLPVETHYALSGKEAIKEIKEAHDKGKKYDLVVTDLEMETKDAGIGVVRKALETLAYTTIVTGRNYDKSDTASHGPNTMIIPTRKSINGRKNKPEIWEFALRESLEYATSEKIQNIYKSAKKYNKFIGKTPEMFVDMMLKLDYRLSEHN